ncbi:VOC family protein [Celerinatantimonas sp. YJH-8]|uniref:VOC family protein n=1 Tax=Celerinatantimonas sp. YJH-8 TaxID=3228714 RepID=UPI0038BED1D9
MDISEKKSLSLDHILLTVKNYYSAYENLKKLGFQMTQISNHPWGTATSFAVFQGNFIELIGVVDETKFGINATNGFCFGRQINKFHAKGEDGISMIALHSKDTVGDYSELNEHHNETQGIVDFRRTITLEDGTPDDVVVTIGLFLDSQHTEASSFICHQHRPDLIWKDEWMVHPNGAIKIEALTYIGEDLSFLENRWTQDYGCIEKTETSFSVNTQSGLLRAVSPSEFRQTYSQIDLPVSNNPTPHVAAVTLSTASLDPLIAILDDNEVPYYSDHHRVLVSPTYSGNVILEFIPWQAAN